MWAEGGLKPVVGLLGPFDSMSASAVAPYLSIALTEAGERVTIDLSRVSLLASVGIDALFSLRDKATALGREVTLIAPYGTPAQHVLDLVGLTYQNQRI